MPAHAMQRVLVGARADLKAKVIKPLGVVLLVLGILGVGERPKTSRKTLRPAIDPELIVVPGIGLEIRQLRDAGVVVLDGRSGGIAFLIELVFVRAVMDKEFAGV